jgi:hypothetical protein
MVAAPDFISGREALHRLDDAVETARSDFQIALSANENQTRRRNELVKLRAEGYHELAKMRLGGLKEDDAARMSAAERSAVKLLDDHQAFIATIGERVAKADAALAVLRDRRREAEVAADAALQAYEAQVAKTEQRIAADPAYLALKQGADQAKAVTARAAQKLELAKTDRETKAKPYESDPLFNYLWERKFRQPAYHGGGLTRMLDNWVAKTCRYDDAWLNYARLVELPDRLAEHVGRMKLEEAEAQAAIGRFESGALEQDGSGVLSKVLADAKAKLAAVDADHAAAEAALADLRNQQERAAAGDSGPHEEACRLIEEGLTKISFPDLKVLAAQTTTLEDDRIVDVLVKLRTQELQMDVDWRNLEAQPPRRRSAAEALETVRQKFKNQGLDSPQVMFAGPAFLAALAAYGGANADADQLWRAIANTIRQAPGPDDDYFGGPRRGRSIGVGGIVTGMAIDAILQGALNGGRGGRWGGGGWGGGGGGFGGGGGGFHTGGKF